MQPATRLAEVTVSPIRTISDGAPPDAMPLGLGQPGWEMPEPARKALAGIAGVCGYGPNVGLADLRDGIARFHHASRDEVMVTNGSQEALFVLTQAWLSPGDAVLIPDPGFPAYPALARYAGATSVAYPLDATNRLRLNAAALIKVLDATPKARVVIVNHPSNPTGSGASAAALRAVADACRERDILLVSDEVYRDLYFDARPASLREVSDFGVVTSSVSKAWGSPGLRIGWAIGDPRWLAPAATVHTHAITSTAIPSQRAALALIEASSEVLPAARRELRLRWEALDAALKEHLPHLRLPPADGSFYLWLPLPKLAPGITPVDFAIELRDKAKVVIIPGVAFGEAGRGHARVSFAAQPDQIREGIRRLAPFWEPRKNGEIS